MSIISKIYYSILYFFSLLMPIIVIYFIFLTIILYLIDWNLTNILSLIAFSSSILALILSVVAIYLGILFSFIFPNISKYTKFIVYLGIIFFILSFFAAEITTIKSLSGVSPSRLGWVECTQPKGIFNTISCLLTGYMSARPTANLIDFLVIYGFWIYGFVFPISILSYLFIDGISSSGMIQNETYKNIIAISLSFLAYRGFIITKLMNFLYIGFFGVIIMIINLFVARLVIKKVNKLFIRFEKIEKNELNKQKAAQLKSILKTKLSEMKTLPTIHSMSNFFRDSVELDLRTVLENEGRLNLYQNLVNEFVLARDRNDRNGMIASIDKMIAAIG